MRESHLLTALLLLCAAVFLCSPASAASASFTTAAENTRDILDQILNPHAGSDAVPFKTADCPPCGPGCANGTFYVPEGRFCVGNDECFKIMCDSHAPTPNRGVKQFNTVSAMSSGLMAICVQSKDYP